MEIATFAAGCFWGVEAAFRRLDGVRQTQVGYMGGHQAQPRYQDVCADRTGHAEVVQVAFDPTEVSYERLLELFFGSHDPTTLNRQGPDVGSQYRSAVFYHHPQQQAAAQAAIASLEQAGLGAPVVTEVVPAAEFWPAEEYHQRYLEKQGLASCSVGLNRG